MPTILADSFTAALSKLTNDEQKQAKLTAFDLQTEPDRPGLQFHRIDRSKDPNFWSVRVSRDLRIIVHRTGTSLLLAYVGHHDDAYDWAERRRIEQHPSTGVLQIVEVRERVEELSLRTPVQVDFGFTTETIAAPPLAPSRSGTAARLFEGLSRDDLMSVGVPADWLDDVSAADDDGFLVLADHLPAEAAEALLDYISTGELKRPEPTLVDAGLLAHPDSLRRFRVVENVEEMEAALAFPWEKWSVFLHPAQRGIVERNFSGPARVVGSAGTGKTVVALHRAARLAGGSPDARILLATFSEPLANALAHKVDVLVGKTSPIRSPITVASFRGIADQLHVLAFGRKAHLASREVIRTLVKRSFEAVAPEGFSEQFLLSEWANVVDAWQVPDIEAYAAIPRMGRRTRLGARQREAIWPLFQQIRSALEERRLMTPASLFSALSRHYAGAAEKPFTHIVVDEAQDLSVPELRFIAALATGDRNALFFAGDLGQRIFQPPFSWKGLGVDVRGRSTTLKVNYRTSHQIRMAADLLLPRSVRDVDGLEDERAGTISVFNGPQPQVVAAADLAEEIDAVAAFVKAALDDGIEPGEIGLFVRSRAELPRARAVSHRVGVGAVEVTGRTASEPGRIAIGTMHFAKGLEFKAVAVLACDEHVIPAAERLSDVSDEMELDEVYATERQLLYVAATRARDRLLLSGVAPISEFLFDLTDAAAG